MNPADFFTKKISPTKCKFYIDVLSGSATQLMGFDNSLPTEIGDCMLSESRYQAYIPKRVHQAPHDTS
jgi:hypothetical protein